MASKDVNVIHPKNSLVHHIFDINLCSTERYERGERNEPNDRNERNETSSENDPSVYLNSNVDRCSGKRSNETNSENDSSIYPSFIHPTEKAQLNNLFLNLKSSTRDSLIRIMIQLSSLPGKEVAREDRDKLVANITGLIEQLSDLKLRFNEFDERPRKRAKHDRGSTGKQELTFAIDWSTRSRIISLLIANKNFAFPNKTDSTNIRDNLVKQNTLMLQTLLNFRTDRSMEAPVEITDGRGLTDDTEPEPETSLNGNDDSL